MNGWDEQIAEHDEQIAEQDERTARQTEQIDGRTNEWLECFMFVRLHN